MAIKVTQHRMNHFKVNNSVAFGTFTVVCHHHLCLVLKYSCHPQRNPIPTVVTPHSPPPAPGNHQTALCLWMCLCQAFSISAIAHWVTSCVWLLSPAQCSRDSSCSCVSLLPSCLCRSLFKLVTLDTAPPRPSGLSQDRLPLSWGCHQRHWSTSENQSLPWPVGRCWGKSSGLGLWDTFLFSDFGPEDDA